MNKHSYLEEYRIIRGLKEEADEHDTGVKAIVNYFARIYYDDHPSKSVESLTENPNFKSFLDDEITKFEQKRILFVDANQCNQRIVMQFVFSLGKRYPIK